MNHTDAETTNNASSRFEQLYKCLEQRHALNSELITQHVLNSPSRFSVESESPERALVRWLAAHDSEWRGSLEHGLETSPEESINAHHGGIADGFVATIPERIRFWSEIRRDMLGLWLESDGTIEITSYLQRLRWVYTVSIDEDFRELDGSHRLAVIAMGVLFGDWSRSDFRTRAEHCWCVGRKRPV
jgi:hypothetical protein